MKKLYTFFFHSYYCLHPCRTQVCLKFFAHSNTHVHKHTNVCFVRRLLSTQVSCLDVKKGIGKVYENEIILKYKNSLSQCLYD